MIPASECPGDHHGASGGRLLTHLQSTRPIGVSGAAVSSWELKPCGQAPGGPQATGWAEVPSREALLSVQEKQGQPLQAAR